MWFLYFILWLLGIAAGWVLRVSSSPFILEIQEHLFNNYLESQDARLQALGQLGLSLLNLSGPYGFFEPPLLWIVLWTLLMLFLWKRPRPRLPKKADPASQYLALWLYGIVAGWILLVTIPAMLDAVQTQPGRQYVYDRNPLLQAVSALVQAAADLVGPYGLFHSPLRWAALWTLLVLLLWSWRHLQRSSLPDPTIRRISFLLIWAVGGLLVALWGLPLIESIISGSGGAAVSPVSLLQDHSSVGGGRTLRVGDGPTPDDIPSLLALLSVWSLVVFLAYLYVGDGDPDGFHRRFLRPYQAVLATLAFVIVFTILANSFAYRGIQQRVQGLNAAERLLNQTVQSLSVTSNELHQTAGDFDQLLGTSIAQALRDEDEDGGTREAPTPRGVNPPANDSSVITIIRQSDGTRVFTRQEDVAPGQIYLAGSLVVSLARDTRNLACSALMQVWVVTQGDTGPSNGCDAGPTPPRSLASVSPVGTPVADPSSSVLASVEDVLEHTAMSTADMDNDATELEGKIPGPNPPDGQELTELGMEVRPYFGRLAIAGRDTADHAAIASSALAGRENRGTSVVLWVAAFYSSFVLLPWVLLLMFLYRKRRFRAVEIITDLERLDPSGKLLERALGMGEDASDPASQSTRTASGTPIVLTEPLMDTVRRVLDRAFSSKEYVLSVTLLTVLTAAGWFYFLYPRAGIGLAHHIYNESGILQMTQEIADNASPITMGFAGAYFFVSQMLLRRYLSGDLYPSAFLQASVRIIWVFTLSVALEVLLPDEGFFEFLGNLAPIVAFVAGVFPQEGFRVINLAVTTKIGELLNSTLKIFPEGTQPEKERLTTLDGIDIWVESRLLEENVENVQGMATAPIEQLVVGTFYPAGRIVNWVDQAIFKALCVDADSWCEELQGITVRTASSLLNVAGFDLARWPANATEEFCPTEEQLASTVKALENAQPGRDKELTTSILREMCKVIWPNQNLRYVLAYRAAALHDVTVEVARPQPASAPEPEVQPRTPDWEETPATLGAPDHKERDTTSGTPDRAKGSAWRWRWPRGQRSGGG